MIRDTLFEMQSLSVMREREEDDTCEEGNPCCFFDAKKGDSPAARARVKQ